MSGVTRGKKQTKGKAMKAKNDKKSMAFRLEQQAAERKLIAALIESCRVQGKSLKIESR